jgi:hypothetical protein
MKPKHFYLVFCVLGAVIPYWQFIRWLATNGLNVSLLVQHLFANRISTFFVLDVVISAIVLLRFISMEGTRLHLKNRWLISLSVVLVGVSLGLPLFLYLRERQLEQANPS